jgi:hypothetical protein
MMVMPEHDSWDTRVTTVSSRLRRRRSSRAFLLVVTPVVVVMLAVASLVTVAYAHDHLLAGRPTSASVRKPLASSSGTPVHTTTTTPPTTPVPTTPPDNPAAAVMAVKAVDGMATSSDQLGVAILDRTTGALTVGGQGATPFYSASVIKLFLIVDVLHDAETGQDTLGPDATGLIQRALSLSDDNAMDTLWEQYDGPAAIDQLVSLVHLQDTQLPSDTTQWGETVISARDVVAVYQYALTLLNPADRDLVMNALGSAADTGVDGFDQAFGLLNPPRPATVKAKQGWMIYGSEMLLHSTGVVGSQNQYVVAVLSQQYAGLGWAGGRANLDSAVGGLLRALGPAAVQ